MSSTGPAESASEVGGPLTESEQRLHFRNAFRDARAKALQDAEGYSELLHVLERLGRFLSGKNGGLGAYGEALTAYANRSPLASSIPSQRRGHHTPFRVLYDQVRRARNAAFHEGAFARHLTGDAITIALILEDSLMTESERVGDYIVRAPICAAMWQPLSFIRQSMLANSFSSLPVEVTSADQTCWQIVGDTAVATFLRQETQGERTRRLAMTLDEAVKAGMKLQDAFVCGPETSICDALARCDTRPILVSGSSPGQLLGIATPFDLL